MKKTKEMDFCDENLKNLSPRSREIATVMRIIKECKNEIFISLYF